MRLTDEQWYLINHYSHLRTPRESAIVFLLQMSFQNYFSWARADHNLHPTSKTPFRTEFAEEGVDVPLRPFRAHLELLAAKRREALPDVDDTLPRDGFRKHIDAMASRLVSEHQSEIHFNYCSMCGGLCRTPKAQQCLRCGHDWHGVTTRTNNDEST